jgi:hippurate hydrolase
VLAGLDGLRSRLEDLYRDLHEHPELSHREQHTAARFADWLQGAGYDVHAGVGCTGVVAILHNGDVRRC